MIDDHTIDVPPAAHLVVVRNEDRPGMIGAVGAVLGDASVNIDDMAVGSSPDGAKALMVIATDRTLDEDVASRLAATDGVTSVAVVGG